MIKRYYRERTFIRACESRRNQQQESPLIANATLAVAYETKWVLRTETLERIVTLGSPKRPKTYGDGVPVVAARNLERFLIRLR